jgi:hypothetical protein
MNAGAARNGTITVGGNAFVVDQAAAQPSGSGGPYGFVPVAPCRVMDTREPGRGTLYGPPNLGGGVVRQVPIGGSICGIPASATAFSINITVVPFGSLGFLSVWPGGSRQPYVSTLNSQGAKILSNAAIVPAGVNGSIALFASDPTDVVVDINGYFTTPGPSTLQFYPVTPCRVVDTRPGLGKSGAFGPPSMTVSGVARQFPILSGGCNVPAAAQAYSLNFTVVPIGKLAFLTTWPSNQPQPFVSTLNSLDGRIVANAAIVPASTTDGSISVYTYSEVAGTDVVIDINGYFAPPGPGGLSLYTITPCRAADTRLGLGGSNLSSASPLRTFPLSSGACNVPSTVRAYSLNATVVPSGPLGFLAAWPNGLPQPGVSTLNSTDGSVVANAALVPAGADGSINIYVNLNPGVFTDLVLDLNGYFAP